METFLFEAERLETEFIEGRECVGKGQRGEACVKKVPCPSSCSSSTVAKGEGIVGSKSPFSVSFDVCNKRKFKRK